MSLVKRTHKGPLRDILARNMRRLRAARGLSQASAVMTMLKPDSHTVIDFRALEALGYKGNYHSVTFYLSYLSYCKALARKWGMTLRDLDRALWQWSKDHGKAGS
jgi:hypothetical protein